MGAGASGEEPLSPTAVHDEPGTGVDLREVRADIASLLPDRSHDDGSLGPLMIRFAWHNCGTYCKDTGTGGSYGGTMRFPAEADDPENAGFARARELIAEVHRKHPRVSLADLAVLAGGVAIEAAGGPRVPFRAGRRDYSLDEAIAAVGSPSGCPFGDGKLNPCGSRLPSADLGPAAGAPEGCPAHVREAPTIAAVRGTFRRMGFDDRETVLLIVLGHQFGRCHPDVSGNEEAWYAFDPAHWNVYEHGLGYLSVYTQGIVRGFRERRTAANKRQFEMRLGGAKFMLLISDMCLLWDDEFRRHIEYYDRDRVAFKRDAIAAWVKLTELGCEGLLVPELA